MQVSEPSQDPLSQVLWSISGREDVEGGQKSILNFPFGVGEGDGAGGGGRCIDQTKAFIHIRQALCHMKHFVFLIFSNCAT